MDEYSIQYIRSRLETCMEALRKATPHERTRLAQEMTWLERELTELLVETLQQ